MVKKSAVNEEHAELKIKIGGLAKGLSTLCLVLRIFLYLGIFCTVIGLVALSMVMKAIKIEDGNIMVMDKKIEYKISEDNLASITVDGKEYNLKGKDIIKISKDSITEENLIGIKRLIVIALMIAIIVMVLSAISLKKMGNLLKRIHDEEKVFVENGHLELLAVMKLYIAILVVTLVGSIICDIVASTSASININFASIISAIVFYFLSLVYKYGESIEE